MKLVARRSLPSLLLMASSTLFAAQGSANLPTQSDPFSADSGMSELTKYFLNLGQYLGYNLQVNPAAPGSDPSQRAQISSTLVNASATQLIQDYMFNSFLGALMVNTAAQSQTAFVPSSSQAYAAINAFANYTFKTPPYNSPSQQNLSVSPLVDQKTYQADPVSQAVLNIIATPDYSYCMNYDGTQWDPPNFANCNFLTQQRVMLNVIGPLPGTRDFFSYQQSQALLSQLNANSLIAPLLYSTTSSDVSSIFSSPIPNASANQKGLPTATQAQQAANFIRYATGGIAPISLPRLKDYDTLFSTAQNSDNSHSLTEQIQAQSTLTNYLSNLRVYAAQSSVGISNLYYLLSKRLPQNQSATNTGQQTSQALSEFTMASWRLYNPDQTQSPNPQWIEKIDKASPATVQKEMLILLAEINYQLYLSRQQEERILMTNTMMLMQNMRNPQLIPNITLTNTGD